jgi:phage/plasmid-associated DNA primase
MNYICSVNRKVAAHLDKNTGKIPVGGNFTAFNENWKPVCISISDLAEEIGKSAGLCAWHLVEGKRQKNNTGLIQAGMIIVDIDNQADGKDQNGNKIQKQELTFEEALDLEICKKYLTFAYDSPSTTAEWPRFRLVFGLEKPIIDPAFYQWFTREICRQIPGFDIRATQCPNLFYGARSAEDILLQTDKFIPAAKIDEAYSAYASLPQAGSSAEGDPEQTLKGVQVSQDGLDLALLVSQTVKAVLNGEPVDDRSSTMAAVFKELIGWANWLGSHDVTVCASPLTIAQDAFYAIYDYPHDLDGKFNRILGSIHGVSDLLPAVSLASELGALAPWKKIRAQNREVFEQKASAETKEAIKQTRATPSNSILAVEDFNLGPMPQSEAVSTTTTSTSTSTSTSNPNVMNTPQTPTQLINLQNAGGNNNRQFSENDVADIIVTNQGDDFIYDSNLDQFYTYDNDLGIWYAQDEQHIKRRIVKALDSFVTAGVMAKYNSATVSSVFQILKAKLLKSVDGGRRSIWSKGRRYIPFQNGVLDSETFDFHSGQQKDLYLRSKLAYDYDPEAKCPEFLKWVNKALDTGQALLIQAFCRALLTGYTAGERFLHLVGPGGTGKSTMQQLMIALAGFSGSHTSSLEIIETNKFETYNLIGKRLLLLTDESNYNKRMDVLKKLTSASDTLRAERKYGKEIISFKPECLVCIASNEHISSNDSSSGLERRRLTIVMDKVVPPSERRELLSVYDDRLEGEFVPEMSGIVSWALSLSYDKMRDVLANPVKHVPSIAKTNIEALMFNNQFVSWLGECCLYSPNSATVIGRGASKPSTDEAERGLYVKDSYSELYASYVNFCKACGYKAAAKPRFVERTREALVNILKLSACGLTFKNGLPAITGLRLKAYDLTSDRASYGPDRLPSPVEFAQNPDPTLWETAFQKHDPAKN